MDFQFGHLGQILFRRNDLLLWGSVSLPKKTEEFLKRIKNTNKNFFNIFTKISPKILLYSFKSIPWLHISTYVLYTQITHVNAYIFKLITYLAPGSSPLSALTKASLALFAIIADFPEPALPMSSSGALGVSLVVGPVM